MLPSQVAELLAMSSAFDSRTIGPADVAAWHAVIGDLDLDDAKAALIGWYAEHHERVMPADIRAGVKRIRRDRLERDPNPGDPPSADPGDTVAYIDEVRAGRKALADGRSRDVAAIVAAIADGKRL